MIVTQSNFFTCIIIYLGFIIRLHEIQCINIMNIDKIIEILIYLNYVFILKSTKCGASSWINIGIFYCLL